MPSIRQIILTCIGLMVVAGFAACDDGEEVGEPPTSTTPSGIEATPTPPSPSPTPSEAIFARCRNPEGFSIRYPQHWYTNPGQVVSECSQFHPDRFEVPRGTDERVAAITAYIDMVPFERASAPNERQDADREEMSITGRDAVRLEYETDADPLWPEGTPITIYMISLPPGDDGSDRTLFIDTVGLEPFDYERNQEILDRMAPTVVLTR